MRSNLALLAALPVVLGLALSPHPVQALRPVAPRLWVATTRSRLVATLAIGDPAGGSEAGAAAGMTLRGSETAATPALAVKRATRRMVLAWQVVAAGIICLVCLGHLFMSHEAAAVKIHIGCMSLMCVACEPATPTSPLVLCLRTRMMLRMRDRLPLGTAALSTVRQRKLPPRVKLADATTRRRRIERLVVRHFATSATALYLAALGIGSMCWVRHCARTPPEHARNHSTHVVSPVRLASNARCAAQHQRVHSIAHLSTWHARAGGATFGVWLAAYLSSQPHVWRDQLRARRFSLFTNKRWLWTDAWHRRVRLWLRRHRCRYFAGVPRCCCVGW